MQNNISINEILDDNSWSSTTTGEKRGYIQPSELKELWFHTGTRCNLRCPNCFEGSNPQSERIENLTLADAIPYINEALTLGCQQFSFTGGEPFFNPEMVSILDYALEYNPCLVLTNGTLPLLNNFDKVKQLANKNHQLSFRVSLDYPDPVKHDKSRGTGNFNLSLKALSKLYKAGFKVSVARSKTHNEDSEQVDNAYKKYFKIVGIPEDTRIVSFADLYMPNSTHVVPEITEHCMTTYKTEEQRKDFMCNFSKMIVKKNGRLGIYSCTLVDDDDKYNMGDSLKQAMKKRVILKHHRCYTCFASDTSCSEL